jgi:transposase
MEVVYPRCAGLDVHAHSITACVRSAAGHEVTYQHRTVATTTAGLLDLAEWLETAGCTHVAMEATGVYWKPVWHVLEGQFTLSPNASRPAAAAAGRPRLAEVRSPAR